MDFGLELGRPEVTLRTRSVTGSVTLIPAALPLSASRDSETLQVRRVLLLIVLYCDLCSCMFTLSHYRSIRFAGILWQEAPSTHTHHICGTLGSIRLIGILWQEAPSTYTPHLWHSWKYKVHQDIMARSPLHTHTPHLWHSWKYKVHRDIMARSPLHTHTTFVAPLYKHIYDYTGIRHTGFMVYP